MNQREYKCNRMPGKSRCLKLKKDGKCPLLEDDTVICRCNDSSSFEVVGVRVEIIQSAQR